MLDRLYLPFLGLAAIAAVALAMVWPQGLGDRSPAPFGHAPVLRTPEMQAKMKAETEASESQRRARREAAQQLQSQVLSPTQ